MPPSSPLKQEALAPLDDDYQTQNSDIFKACKNGNLNDVRFFIEERSIDKDSQTKTGYTPLHIAANFGYLDIVQYLVTKGANIEAQTDRESTPLDLAIKAHKDDVAAYLRGLGQ